MDKIIVTRYKNHEGLIGLRLALVTDLHNCKYERILEKIREEKPDLILCAGDILERHQEGMSEWTENTMDLVISSISKPSLKKKIMRQLDMLIGNAGTPTDAEEDIAIEFLKVLPTIAPTFYSVGNHEWYFTKEDYHTFQEYQVTLLDNTDCEVEIKGKKLKIGGLSSRYDLKWLGRYSQKCGYKILMCHHPEYYREAIKNTPLDVFDLIVSGHYHGGQWRLLNRAVYVPRIGFLVKNAVGQFGKMVISAGVANTTRLPRLGNPCELVVIEI